MNDTATIRARIHDSAIKRVTRTFSASIGEVFSETLQNSRRAGATRVRVAVAGSDGNLTVTVTDDGAGIADPAILLSFGENGWSEDLVAAEDAAGMGMLSLARRGCTVSSRPRAPSGAHAPGWRVELLTTHFLGEAEAEVHPDDAAPWPHGAAVSFRASGSEDAERIRRAIEQAARHYPLPVMFEDVPDTPAGGETLDRRAFLDGALHVERWRGLVFGAFKDRWNGFGLNDPDVNFHGLTVSAQLPRVESVTGECWTAGADIVDCPDLELVLPARKEPVETPFLQEMREAARLAIYRAMAADPDPRPSFADRKRAHEADIAAPPPELRPWRPGLADVDDWREPPKRESVGPDALLMACDPEPPEAQALWRAAERNGIAGRLFEPDRRLEGYAWYDAIERIVHIHTEASVGRRPHALDRYPAPERSGAPGAPLAQRPDSIRMSLAVRPDRGVGRILDLDADADVAFAGDAWAYVGDALPLVTAGSDIEPFQLMELLRAAFFSASDDADADSRERQRDVFEQEALHIAMRLLVSDDAARRRSIAEAVTRELFWLIPHDRGAEISVRDRKVTVTLGAPAAQAAAGG